MKTIAVIGALGTTGWAIADALAKTHHRVLLTDHLTQHPALSLSTLHFPQPRVEIVRSAREASWEADIILLAIPYDAQSEVASNIKDVVTGKIIISAVNPINKNCDGLLTPPTTSAAEELAQLLPHARIVKAFNTLSGQNLKRPQITGQITDVFVAGDDDEAVSIVKQLVVDAGFTPLSAGNLAMSRILENMLVLLIGLSARNNLRGPIGWKVLHETINHDEDEYHHEERGY
jgi:NADPH-dependent F420 reductase